MSSTKLKALAWAVPVTLGLAIGACQDAGMRTVNPCTVYAVPEGTAIECGGSVVVVPDGADGQDGADGADGQDGADGADGQDGAPGRDSIVDIIDPCGDHVGHFDEILLVLSSGQVLAYFENGSFRHLVILEPGRYRTTDKQRCEFEVLANGSVVW